MSGKSGKVREVAKGTRRKVAPLRRRRALYDRATTGLRRRAVGTSTRRGTTFASADVVVRAERGVRIVIVVGVILLLLGLLLSVPVLWVIGVVLVVVGAVLWIAGSAGHAVGGRRHYY